MSGKVKLVYTISKEAAKLVKSGNAVISSGGVRALDGTIIEMAKPAAKAVVSNGGSVLGTMSSLANNVQSAFIQKGVNQANKKLDLSLNKLDMIQKSIDNMANANMLCMVNSAIGIANCGISIAGFALVLNSLDKVSEKISELTDVVKDEILRNQIEKFDRLRMNIKADVAMLQKIDTKVAGKYSYIDHINETAAYLRSIISAFNNKCIDGQIGCTIIFNLAVVFAQEVSEYSARYYYENGEFPVNYEEWVSIIESINSNTFKEYLKNFIMFEKMDMSMKEKYAVYSGAVAAIEAQLDKMAFSREAVLLLEEKDYIRIDDYLKSRVESDTYETVGDKVCIPLEKDSVSIPM